ncbi:hypothetical protein ILYODFUR_000592 [Ilyodon furcidens]|uniref:Uncharacterized protein n=1 Tax=Ilyodon furcidens TaxID=33524 RepID=A0ABV0TEY3_9TELE
MVHTSLGLQTRKYEGGNILLRQWPLVLCVGVADVHRNRSRGFLPTVPRAFHLPRRIEDQLPAHSGDPRAQKSSPHHSLTALRERGEAEARLDSQVTSLVTQCCRMASQNFKLAHVVLLFSLQAGHSTLDLMAPIRCLRNPTSQPEPIGLLQLEGIPYCWHPPPGSGIAATTGTADLTATAKGDTIDNRGREQ